MALLGFNSRTPGGVRLAKMTLTEIQREFQFTHPGRGATTSNSPFGRGIRVSIHAPREGCDVATCRADDMTASFNSRTPGGVRLLYVVISDYHEGFNSRTPGGVRRYLCNKYGLHSKFQFTHPGRGATQRYQSETTNLPSFNSRTPGGVRRAARS